MVLSTQEEFESKKATMVMAQNKLSSLQNAILLESRAINTIFFYLIMMFELCALYVDKNKRKPIRSDVFCTLYFAYHFPLSSSQPILKAVSFTTTLDCLRDILCKNNIFIYSCSLGSSIFLTCIPSATMEPKRQHINFFNVLDIERHSY